MRTIFIILQYMELHRPHLHFKWYQNIVSQHTFQLIRQSQAK